MKSNYLLEIGVEEIPARLVQDAVMQLKSNAEKILKEKRIGFENIKTYSTPRRLTIIIENMNEKQDDLKESSRGPSKKIAYDEEGNPSKALEGFMRGQDVTIEDIVVEEYKGEEYVFANILKEGKLVKEIIPEIVPEMIKSINFPKTMKWGGRDFKFIRPIRWIVSILDGEIIPFNFEEIKVSNITRGHRFLGSSNIEINEIDKYENKLKENYVIADPEKRMDIIKMGAERLVRERGGNLEEDDALMDEINNIVEYPTPIIGRIKKEYLELPEEVIITPMKEHLRYLPVFDDKGRLMPYFITVRNGDSNHIETVIKGNEKVLGARLEDAKFFYEEDKSKKLEEYVEELKNIIFQEKLGTVYDKVLRLQELGEEISSHMEVGEETENNVKRAAYLSKADLVTKLVNEFSELQGVMGSKYARLSGENEIVSLAIEEQYLPKYSGDKIPTTTSGLVLSITDKLDNICGLFAVGIKPTGSQDPFALRRQALAIINILMEKRLNLNLSELIETSLYIYVEKNGLAFDSNKVKEEISEFFNIRINNVLKEKGIRYDVIDAVVGKKINNIPDLLIKSEKISKWLEKGEVEDVIESFNRISNLASKYIGQDVDEELFNEYESKLYNSYKNVKEIVDELIREKDYDKALEELVALVGPIDEFFENVMVMVEDENLKNNRLSILKKIDKLTLEICELSKIVIK